MAPPNYQSTAGVSRRRFLGAIAGAVIGGLSGCVDGDETTSPADGESPNHDDVSQFRGDIQGSGFFPERTVPRAVELHREISGINKWTHTAAKGSPTVSGDEVYVGGDTGTFRSFTLDGSLNWGAATQPSQMGIHGTPAVTAETAYIGAYDGAMYAYSRSDGTLRWRTEIGDAIGSSPRYYDGKIFVSVETNEPSGIMSVLDATSGELLWSDPRVTNHPHSTVALDPTTETMVVGANDGVLYAWDLDTYEYRWSFEVDGVGDQNTGHAIKGPILAYDGAAFFGSWDETVYRVDLDSGTEEWQFETNGYVMSGAGVDPRTSNVIIGSHDGNCYCLDATTGEMNWRLPTNGKIIGCPVITEESILIGSYDRHLYALDRITGEVQWSYAADGWVTSTPAVADGHILFTDRATIENRQQAWGNDAGALYVLESVDGES